MFVGTYIHQIDDKGRMRIPAKFKQELGEDPFIMQGAQKCLYIYPRKFAEKMFDEVFGGGKFTEKEKNSIKARIMSKACYGEEDTQGRVTIPSALLKYAGIEKATIASVAAYDHIQIWNKELWDRESENDNAGGLFDWLKDEQEALERKEEQ